jgi:hypothetical protein
MISINFQYWLMTLQDSFLNMTDIMMLIKSKYWQMK